MSATYQNGGREGAAGDNTVSGCYERPNPRDHAIEVKDGLSCLFDATRSHRKLEVASIEGRLAE